MILAGLFWGVKSTRSHGNGCWGKGACLGEIDPKVGVIWGVGVRVRLVLLMWVVGERGSDGDLENKINFVKIFKSLILYIILSNLKKYS